MIQAETVSTTSCDISIEEIGNNSVIKIALRKVLL
jgi:hypothetical protein